MVYTPCTGGTDVSNPVVVVQLVFLASDIPDGVKSAEAIIDMVQKLDLADLGTSFTVNDKTPEECKPYM
jgi:hypothetical protein